MQANRNYKDSVFVNLFSDPGYALELYEAISGEKAPPDTEPEINTISDVLWRDQLNDLSFALGDKQIILMEAQSTINPNMCLRMLEYVGRLYEKITPRDMVYGSKRLVLPRPDFYVLYNGVKDAPDKYTMKLSDMFADAPAHETLELTVTMYNINRGHNEDMLAKSETLTGYAELIAKVREYEKDEKIFDIRVKKAIKYCIEHGYIPDYLKKHESEVSNMLIYEYDRETDIRVNREEAAEEAEERNSKEIARNLKSLKAPLSMITESTGLTAEQVEAL